MRFRLSSTLKRPKTLMKTKTFENGFKSGDFWKRLVSGVNRWKRIEMKSLTSSDDTENGYFWKRICVDSWKRCENDSVNENIFLSFLRDENGDLWNRIRVDGA